MEKWMRSDYAKAKMQQLLATQQPQLINGTKPISDFSDSSSAKIFSKNSKQDKIRQLV